MQIWIILSNYGYPSIKKGFMFSFKIRNKLIIYFLGGLRTLFFLFKLTTEFLIYSLQVTPFFLFV